MRVLSRVFRKDSQRLQQAFARQDRVPWPVKRLAEPVRLSPLARRRDGWVVYATRPFGEPANVLKYLARYTHRVAIANSRW